MNSSPRISCIPRQSRQAFTLLELLVVISIIAILSGLALPIYKSVNAKSTQMRCANSLKIWGTALQLYAADNNALIQVSNWASIGSTKGQYYEPYLKPPEAKGFEINGVKRAATEYYRHCPSQQWDPRTANANAPLGYAMIRPNPKVANSGTFSMANASHPATSMLMIESSGAVESINDQSDWNNDFPATVKPTCDGTRTARHPGGANVLFADGHVQTYQWADLNPTSANNTKRMEYWMSLGGTAP